MTGFRIQGFGGLIPRLSDRLIPDNAARVATNVKLYSGELSPIKQPLSVFETNHAGALQTFSRMPDGAGSTWLGFTADTDVVRAPIAGDTTSRRYYTSGAHEPRVTNLAMAKSGAGGAYPATFYALGVPDPVTKPTLAAGAGGVSPNVTVAYVYIFVTQWGEKSAPSPAETITKLTGQTVNLSALDVAPPNSGGVTAARFANGVATVTLNATFGLRAGERISFAAIGGAVELNATHTIISAKPGISLSGQAAGVATATGVLNPGTGLSGNAAGVATATGTLIPGTTEVTIALASMTAYTTGGTWSREAPFNTTGMVKRIFRTVSGNSATDYQFVAEIPAATTAYADSVADSALGELLDTLDWDMPPTDLHSIAALPGGAMIGLSKNEVCFSEPYQPHAWPIKYRQTMAYNGVAIGVFGATAAIATDGVPYTASGTDPSTITLIHSDLEYPCINKRGAASFDFGLMYPSYAGLVLVGIGGSKVVTQDLYTADEWKLINPETLVAAAYNGRYYGIYTRSDGGNQMIILDRTEGVILLEADVTANAIYADLLDGNLYVANVTDIQKWDGDDGHKLIFDWLSKEFMLPYPMNLGAAKVEADFAQSPAEILSRQAAYDAEIAANAAFIAAGEIGGEINAEDLCALIVNGSNIPYPPELEYESLQFTLYDGDTVILAQQITDNSAFVLPSEYKTDTVSVRLSGNVIVKSVKVAETMIGLKDL